MQPRHKTPSIAEEENYEHYDRESTTRASGSTSLKRKSESDEKDAKKITGTHTVIIMHNPTIHHFGHPQSTTTSPRTPTSTKGAPTVQSTPRAT
eukprot:2037033-Amphidinium_carterae.1